MSSQKSQKLRQSILKYNTEMSKLKDELSYSQEANEKYNKLNISRPKEKLICDYFKS